MAISRRLAHRVEIDAKAPDFWYVPKGQAVNCANWSRIADHLRVLSKFQSVPWHAAQPRFARELFRRRLIKPYKGHRKGFSPVARMQFPVWRLLGLAWINTNNVPEVTEVGRLFMKARSQQKKQELLTMQLHRYQFYNPSLARHFSAFRTFPVLALYRLMSQVGWKITWDEFRLFGTRIRNFDDADELAELIDEWRMLQPAERTQLLSVAKTVQAASHTKSKEGTTWGKVARELAYVQAILSILPTLDQNSAGITVFPAARKRVNKLVLDSASYAQLIDYASEQDWLALYGQTPSKERWAKPWSTVSEARTYYERIGKIDAATEAYEQEEKGRTHHDIERYKKIQILERTLEDLLEHNLEALEKGLVLVKRQHPTAVGPIDLLAKDANGVYVVIELKRGRSGDKVVGQIARYITWVVQRLSGGKKGKVRGIIVGKNFDKKFAASIEQLKRVSSYTYDVEVWFERWPASKKNRMKA